MKVHRVPIRLFACSIHSNYYITIIFWSQNFSMRRSVFISLENYLWESFFSWMFFSITTKHHLKCIQKTILVLAKKVQTNNKKHITQHLSLPFLATVLFQKYVTSAIKNANILAYSSNTGLKFYQQLWYKNPTF